MDDTVVCDECKGTAEFVAVINNKNGKYELYVCKVCGHENLITLQAGTPQKAFGKTVKSFPR